MTEARYAVSFDGVVYTFDDVKEEMETEDMLVYVAAGTPHGGILAIGGCLRGEHDDVIAGMKQEPWCNEDVVFDGPWFPWDREVD